MIRFHFRILVVALMCCGMYFTSCKSKPKDTGNTTVDTSANMAPAPTPVAPVEIAADDELKNGVRDATKDFPGVNAEVNNGEITLTGQIERTRLPKLMMALNSLKPKKINNNLTVK